MSLFSPDTTPEAARVLVAALRRQDPAVRMRQTFALNRAVRDRVRQAIDLRHPEWDEPRRRDEFRRLWLGDELYAAVYGSTREPCGD